MAKRTTKFTKEFGEQLVERIRECGSVERACTALGFFGASVRKRVRTHPDDDFGRLVGAELEANRKRWRTPKQKAAKKRVAKPGNGAKPARPPADAHLSEEEASLKRDLRAQQEHIVILQAKVLDSQAELGRLRESTESRITAGEALAKELDVRIALLEVDTRSADEIAAIDQRNADLWREFASLRQRADASPTLPADTLTRIRAHLEAIAAMGVPVSTEGVLRLLDWVDEQTEKKGR